MDGASALLSVVVPVRNEEANIEPLIGEIVAALTDVCPFEIIYIDDGSDDGTAGRLSALQELQPALRVLHHERSYGQSAAVWTGVRSARGAWVATLDGDGQNDPADLPRMIEARDSSVGATSGAIVMIAGQRIKRQDSRIKLVSSRIANGVRSRLLRDGCRDTGCGLKLFRRDAFLALPRFNHMHRFLPALVRRDGGECLFVDVSHRPRERGRSKYGLHNRLWVGIIDLFGVRWLLRRSMRPRPWEEVKS